MPKSSNVYRDKRNGSWYFVANLGTDAEGKRVRHWGRGYKTQKDAKAAYDAYMADFSKTAVRGNSTMSFGEFYRSYWEPDYRGRVRESTFYARCSIARKHFGAFDRLRLRDITPPMVKRWQNGLLEGHAPSYARLVFGHFAMVLDMAVQLGLLQRNPARQVGNIPKRHREVDFWTRDEFERVIATFDTSEYYGLYGFTCLWLLYMTGLRLGEAQALRWSAIDFGEGVLSVDCSMYYRNVREWKLTSPKTNAGKRAIALDALTLEYLERWRGVQRRNVVTDFVLSWNGDPFARDTIGRIIDRHAPMAGVHRIRPHGLRHSHVALLIALGVNVLSIANRLGHRDVSLTLNVYGHLMHDARREVALRLDDAFSAPSGGQPICNLPSPSDPPEPARNGTDSA